MTENYKGYTLTTISVGNGLETRVFNSSGDFVGGSYAEDAEQYSSITKAKKKIDIGWFEMTMEERIKNAHLLK